LESVGWSALIIGRARVQQQIGARKMNYEFVVDFTGGKKQDAAAADPAGQTDRL
jgi:hypothetical protein